MTNLITILGQPLTAYGMGAAMAMLMLLYGVAMLSRLRHLPRGTALRFAVLAPPLCLLCSRLVYVAASYAYYLQDIGDWTLMLRFWDGGYSMIGAFGGVVLAAFLTECWTRTPHGALLDVLGTVLPVILMCARTMERGTGLGEGAPVPEGWPATFTIETAYGSLHTVFLYEAIAAAVIFLIVLLWQYLCRRRRPGDVLLMFTLLFGCTQVVMESLREDGHMTVHMGVSVQQVLAALLVLIALGIWTARAAKAPTCRRWWPALTAVLALMLVALAVVAEFGVDRWDSKVAAYGLMIACLIGLLELAGISRRLSYRTQD